MYFWDIYKCVCFSVCKGEFKEICEETSFPSLFQKNAEVSIFVEIKG